MNPGVWVAGGGGAGGGGSGSGGKGKGGKEGAGTSDGKEGAADGGKSADGCGSPGKDGGGCPNHHGGSASGSMAQGDPVDVATGRTFTLPVKDVDLPGPLPLVFERAYNSEARDTDIGLGHGWSHSFAWELRVKRREVRVFTSHGSEAVFGPVEENAASLGAHGWLLHRDGEHYILDFPSGLRRVFKRDPGAKERAPYRLVAIEDRYRNRISLSYEKGLLITIVDSVGRELLVQRDSARRIRHLAVVPLVGAGATTFATFSYDGSGNLTEVFNGDGVRTGYAYDARHLLTEFQRPIGITFFFRYNAAGRCVETWGAYPEGKDPCLSERAQTVLSDSTRPAKGIHHIALDYDDSGFTEAVDAVTHHTYFSNEAGKVDKAVSAGKVYLRTYDKYGYLASFTDPMGATTRWERDIFGNETLEQDALGYLTTIERHPNGDIRRIIHANSSITEVSYSPGCISWVDPIGAQFQVFNDSRGLTTGAIAPNGTHLRYVHDAHGNLTHLYEDQTLRRSATYDPFGRMIAEQDATGSVTRYRYSTMSRLLAVEHADGTVWRQDYDGEGNLIRQIDPEGRVTTLVRGGTGSLADAHLPDGTTVRLRYDRQERLMEVFNAAGEVYRIERNFAGLPIRETTFDGRVISRTYDLANRVTRIKRGTQNVDLERDLLGHIIKREYDDVVESFEYDPLGSLIAAKTPDSDLFIQRNALGWITREEQTVDSERVAVDYEDDACGRPLSRRTSLGHRVDWAWDDKNHRTQIRLDQTTQVGVQRDVLGQELARLLPAGGRMEFRYDVLGRLAGQRTFDTATSPRPGEPTWVGPHQPGLSVDLQYVYSRSSELQTVFDVRQGTTQFKHDPLGQLIEVESPSGTTQRFHYDVARNLYEVEQTLRGREYVPGNLLQRKGDTEYFYDEEGRLIEKRQASVDGAPRVTQYEWNGKGLLSALTLPSGNRVEFVYDALARRIEKRFRAPAAAGGRVLRRTRFVWAKDCLVHEIRDQEGAAEATLRSYCFDEGGAPWAHQDAVVPLTKSSPAMLGGRLNIEQSRKGDWQFYLNDVTSRPVKLVDAKGVVTCELDWDAWGKAQAREGATTDTAVRWLGHYADEETGLHYNVHRYYDPEIGRYIAPDPLELLGGINAYAYAKNQPTEYADPLGLIYSRIVDKDGNPISGKDGTPFDGKNIGSMGAGTSPAPIDSSLAKSETDPKEAGKRCAERDALSKMAKDIRQDITAEQKKVRLKDRLNEEQTDAEVRKRMKKRFDDEGLMIETFEHEGGDRVDPCKACGAMFESLGITGSVVGEGGKKGEYGEYKAKKGGKGGKGKKGGKR